jgi:hypothetical protein
MLILWITIVYSCTNGYSLSVVHLFELGTARSLVDVPPIRHGGGVVEIALNQAGSPGERQLVLVDKNRDMYLTYIRGSATLKRLCKLGEFINLALQT